jgi:hypothetical protein
MNVKTDSGVGYLLVDMLRLWHSTVDCASFGLLPEVSLLMGLLELALPSKLIQWGSRSNADKVFAQEGNCFF